MKIFPVFDLILVKKLALISPKFSQREIFFFPLVAEEFFTT